MRATDRSPASITAVTVTLPTRGSLTSRRSSSASERCICAAMRAARALLLAAISSGRSLDRARDFDAREAFDLIGDTHVLIVLHPYAALGSRSDFVHVVLETAQ